MTDLGVLRRIATTLRSTNAQVVYQAADELESLRQQVAELQASYDEAYDDGFCDGIEAQSDPTFPKS